MSKSRLKQLALLGLSSGLVVGCGGGSKSEKKAEEAKSDMGHQHKQMSESPDDAEAALLAQLDDKHRAMFHSLDAEHKELALQMAQQTCAGQNECKGLNMCKGAHNACAGQGSCAGTGGCGWSDQNLMIRVVMKHMAEKRGQVNY